MPPSSRADSPLLFEASSAPSHLASMSGFPHNTVSSRVACQVMCRDNITVSERIGSGDRAIQGIVISWHGFCPKIIGAQEDLEYLPGGRMTEPRCMQLMVDVWILPSAHQPPHGTWDCSSRQASAWCNGGYPQHF